MATDILRGLTRRIDYLQGLTTHPDGAPESRAFFLDVMEGLRTGKRLRDYLAQSLSIGLTEVFDNAIDDCNLAGKLFAMSLDVSLKACEPIQKRVWQAIAKEVPDDLKAEFDGAVSEFEDAIVGLQKLKAEFPSRWPWVNEERLAESIAQEKQGTRGRPAKEVFDELRRRVRRTG